MNEKYKCTDLKCDECKGDIVLDFMKGELYCLDCSLVSDRTELLESNDGLIGDTYTQLDGAFKKNV